MRLQHHLTIIATAAIVAAVTAPVAGASSIGAGGGGLPRVPHHVVASTRDSRATDWALIALAGGGIVAVAGAGTGAARRGGRRRASARPAQAERAG